jgi:hypothetical protein
MTKFPKNAIHSIFAIRLYDYDNDIKSTDKNPLICLTIRFNTLKNLNLFEKRLSLALESVYKCINSSFSYYAGTINNSIVLKTKSLTNLMNLMNTLL